MLERAEALRNDGVLRVYSEIPARLGAGVVISAGDAADVSPERGKWRADNRGYVNASINGKGTPVDVLSRDNQRKGKSRRQLCIQL